jgi:hypothetical protein
VPADTGTLVPVTLGARLTITYLLTNDTPYRLTDVVLADTLLSGGHWSVPVHCPAHWLAPHATLGCVAEVRAAPGVRRGRAWATAIEIGVPRLGDGPWPVTFVLDHAGYVSLAPTSTPTQPAPPVSPPPRPTPPPTRPSPRPASARPTVATSGPTTPTRVRPSQRPTSPATPDRSTPTNAVVIGSPAPVPAPGLPFTRVALLIVLIPAGVRFIRAFRRR